MKSRTRKSRGISTVVLMIFLALFCILPLGLLGFEISRAFLAQQELRNITDSAALSGTAAMASAPETDSTTGLPTTYLQRQQLAMTTALQTFQFNSILQTPLGTSNVIANFNPQPPVSQTPALHNAVLNILLLDQNGNQVATGQPAATMTVQAYWTDEAIWASKILPLGKFTITAFTNGGLPQLDIVLCLDVSGSMDDQTNVWFVNRYWDTSTQKMAYNESVTSSSGVVGRGVMYTLLKPPVTGTALNVYPPQNLSNATYVDGGVGANTNGFTWSETPASGGYSFSTLIGLRSNTTISTGGGVTMPEQGMPPGNYDPLNKTSNRNGLNPTLQNGVGGFTDMVCDITKGGSFPITVNGKTFSSIETVVEAARGNMESSTALKSACCGSVPSQITDSPGAGYFAAYQTWVLQNASPIAQARQSAYNFYNTMNLSANCHFGLICFSSNIGTNASSVYPTTNDNVDAAYPTGGTGTFPNPLVPLSYTNSSATDFTNVTQALEGNPVTTPPVYGASIYPIRAEGSTDIADALTEAVNELNNTSTLAGNPSYRPAAKRAIVLFTDGVPNLPASNPTGLARAQATAANGAGIPIYTIGLSQNPSIVAQEDALLGMATSPSSGGIAGISGNNAIYVSVTSSTQLDQAFQTIARSLCVIQ